MNPNMFLFLAIVNFLSAMAFGIASALQDSLLAMVLLISVTVLMLVSSIYLFYSYRKLKKNK